jgi:hypothetical protein
MSDPDTISKPPSTPQRGARLIQLWPLGLMLVAAMVLCGGWWVERFQLEGLLDRRVADLCRQGFQVELSQPRFSGFPYRMKLDWDSVRIIAPSGWAVRLGRTEAEALLFDLNHWVFAAENGLTVTRPVGGDVRVGASRLRASIASLDAPVPRVALEAVDLVVTTPPGARPFSLSRADRFELYTRTDIKDSRAAEALVRLDNMALTPGTVAAPLFGQRRISAALALRMRRLDAFRGAGWTEAGRNWQLAGGQVEIDATRPPGPDLRLATETARLTPDRQGHLLGTTSLTLTAPDGGRIAVLPLALDARAVRLGPVVLGPAPRLF